MVDNRSTAAANGLQRADESAVVQRLFIQRSIEPPPQVFQRRDKVRTGGDVGLDTA